MCPLIVPTCSHIVLNNPLTSLSNRLATRIARSCKNPRRGVPLTTRERSEMHPRSLFALLSDLRPEKVSGCVCVCVSRRVEHLQLTSSRVDGAAPPTQFSGNLERKWRNHSLKLNKAYRRSLAAIVGKHVKASQGIHGFCRLLNKLEVFE